MSDEEANISIDDLAETSAERPDKYDFSNRRVMLIEDDETLSDLMKAQFRVHGGELIHLASGQGALEKIREAKPEVILLDILLPNQNGFEILKAMRNDPELKDIKVIVVSNLDSEEDLAQAKQLGVEEYLVKSTIVTSEIVDKTWQSLNPIG